MVENIKNETVLETNESLMMQAFNRLSDLNDKICVELRWINRYFINLWQNDNYHKNLKLELVTPHAHKTVIKVLHPKNNYYFYIRILPNSLDVSAYADAGFQERTIYSIPLLSLVNNPNKYIKEIKKLLNKKFKEVL